MNPDFPDAIGTIIQRVQETFASGNPYPDEELPALTPEFERWFDEGVRIIDKQEDPALGVEAFTKALEIDAEAPPAYDNRARLYTDLGEDEKAVADLIEVLQRAPNCPEAFLRLGEALANLGETHLAAKIFAQTILILENVGLAFADLIAERAHLGLAALRLASGDTELARRLVQQALVLKPESIDARLLEAEIHSAEGNLEQALSCLNQALEQAEETVPEILVERAKVLRALGQDGAAAHDFAETLSSLQDDPMATYGVAVKMMEADQTDWALEAISQVIEADPDFAEAYKIRACLLSDEDPEAALKDLQRSVELDPEADDAWAIRADILHNLERFGEALAAYDRALEFNPENIDAMIGIGNVRVAQKEYREALIQFQMALKLEESCPDALLGRALIFSELGDFASALKDAERVLGGDPEHLLGRLVQGEALLETGQLSAAISILQGCVDECPEEYESICLATLATAHLRQGDSDTAGRLVKQAQEASEDDDAVWSVLAELHLRRGDTWAALEAVRAAIAGDPSEYQHHELEGDILQAGGDLSAARKSYATALEQAPGRLVQERLRAKSEGIA